MLTSNIECFGSTFSFVIFSVFSFLALLVCLCLFIRITNVFNQIRIFPLEICRAGGRSQSRPVPAPSVGSFGTESSNRTETFEFDGNPRCYICEIQIFSNKLIYLVSAGCGRWSCHDHVPSCQLIYVDRRQSKMLEKII